MSEQELRNGLYAFAGALIALLTVMGEMTEGTARAVLLVIDTAIALAVPAVAWWFTRRDRWVTTRVKGEEDA
jgi:urea transporter